jgi:S1-C subfamily serine protease
MIKAVILNLVLPAFVLACACGGPLTPEQLQNLSVTVHANGAQGSGVIITRDNKNYVLTAAHVVDDLRKVQKYTDGNGDNKKLSKYEPVTVVREIIREGRSIGKTSIEGEIIAFSSADFGDDLALIELRDAITTDSVVFQSSADIPGSGTPLRHVGSFLGQAGSNSVSKGEVSQVGRTLNGHVFDQSSCPAFPGSSGGGLWREETGEYIGTLVRGAGETFNIYVPIRRIKEWAARHHIEFIFNPEGKIEKDKVILEGLEPDETPNGYGKEWKKWQTMLFYDITETLSLEP